MDTLSLMLFGAAGLSGLSILLIVLSTRLLSRKDQQVSARLEILSNEYMLAEEVYAAEVSPAQNNIAQRLNDAINERSFAGELTRQLEQANLPLTVPEWMLIRVAVPLVLMAGAMVAFRSVLLLPIFAFLGFILPPMWLKTSRNRRSQLFNEQLADTLQMLVGALRGGFSLPQAIRMVTKECQQPTKGELERLSQELQLGLSMNDAMDNLAERIRSEDLDLVVAAIKINNRVGGNLTEIMESISNTIRERYKLRREVRVITSMQRMSSYVIGALPFVLALIIYAINPNYMGKLFVPGWTLCFPIGAAVSAVIGFLLIRKIADIKV